MKLKWDLYVRRLKNTGWDDLLEKGMKSIEVVGKAVMTPNPFTIAEAILSVARTMTANDLYFYDVLDRAGWRRVFPSCIKDQLLEILEPHVTSRVKVNRAGDTTVMLITKPGVRIGWVKENDENTTTDILAHIDDYEASVKFVRDLLWSTVDASRIVLSSAEKNYDAMSVKSPRGSGSGGQVRVVTDDLINSVSSTAADDWVPYLKRCNELDIKRTMLFHGPAGCHAKGQLIMMSDGTLKKVEDIQAGDQLAGPVSERLVLELRRGFDEMVRIVPNKGQTFVVNKDHILTLARNNRVYHKRAKVRPSRGSSEHFTLIDVSVRDWIGWSNSQKKLHKLVRSGPTAFIREERLRVDPYILGALLGDGATKDGVRICSMDDEIVSSFREFAAREQLKLVEVKATSNGRARTYGLTFMKGHSNWLTDEIRRMRLNVGSAEKFVPSAYKRSSLENRKQLLAGLIDTDGHLDRSGCFDFCSKSEQLANDVAFVARSLGLAAYVRPCQKRATNSRDKKFATYYRVSLSGDLSIIPTRVMRKRAQERKQIKNVRMTGFRVEDASKDRYYGFTLDGDGRYLLDDFTITHNTGKSTLTRTVCEKLGIRSLRVRVEDIGFLGTEAVGEIISIFEPDAIIFDDLDRSSSQLALFEMMEMLHRRVKLVFATVNHLSNLADALKRPGRFDEIVYVSKLDEAAMRKLLGSEAADVFEIVKDWPVAFVKEYIIRRKIVGAEKALESVKGLQARVKELMVNYGEEHEKASETENGDDDDLVIKFG